MPDPARMTARLQHRQMPGDIGALVGEGVLQRVAHPRLGGEMHNPVRAALAHQGGEGLRVGDVHPHHFEGGMGGEPRRARRLQADLVVVVEVVDADHGLAALQQTLGHKTADEAGRARNDNGQRSMTVMDRRLLRRRLYWARSAGAR